MRRREVLRRLAVGLIVVLHAASARRRAQCPPSCAGGGGPAATDCFLTWGDAPGKVVTCTDGDGSCDVDGLIDGVCTFGLAACTNVAVGACTATPLDAPPTATRRAAAAKRS